MVLLPKPPSIIDLGEGGEFDDDDDGLNATIDDLEETASAAARVSDGDVRRISTKPVEFVGACGEKQSHNNCPVCRSWVVGLGFSDWRD